MENELQAKLIANDKYGQWVSQLPDYLTYELQNSGFQLHHLIGRYYGYLDEDMTIQSLWLAAGLPVESLPNILQIYQQIINKFNERD